MEGSNVMLYAAMLYTTPLEMKKKLTSISFQIGVDRPISTFIKTLFVFFRSDHLVFVIYYTSAPPSSDYENQLQNGEKKRYMAAI